MADYGSRVVTMVADGVGDAYTQTNEKPKRMGVGESRVTGCGDPYLFIFLY